SGTAAIFQRCVLENRSPRPLPLTIRLRWSSHPPFPRWERWRSGLARRVPRWIRRPSLWGVGWAKVLRPTPLHLRLRSGDVEARDGKGRRWVWEGTLPPHRLTPTGQEMVLEYAVEVPAGAGGEIVWGLKSAEEPESWAIALESAQEYAQWLQAVAAPAGDPLRRSLIVAGLNTALSAFKGLGEEFAGFTAGPDYFYPPRLYFRDGYWTAQVILPYRPDLVRRHLLSLAQGVHPDGRCPSGIFPPDLFGGYTAWLPDHLDAPAFFVLLLADYLRFTEDWGLLRMPVGDGERSLWETAQRALAYLSVQDRNGDGLLEKPWQPNDWADNVRRNVWVTYDQALYIAALRAGAIIAARVGEEPQARRYMLQAQRAQEAMNRCLWMPERGYYANYLRPNGGETNLSIDTLTVLYFGLADEEKTRRLLAAARRLQTRFNQEQPFGDWGVMCVFPPYSHRKDLFGKSADPYRYHNGADWPYWDGVYGAILRERGDEDAGYVLTRWWEYSLEQGWLTPIEFYSPAYPEGGMLQGWSSMPAAALLPPHVWTPPSRFLKSDFGLLT
ncbi:MAG: amylo-alpha-1,6-glucosidase, partial [Anaerolineae bacterium]